MVAVDQFQRVLGPHFHHRLHVHGLSAHGQGLAFEKIELAPRSSVAGAGQRPACAGRHADGEDGQVRVGLAGPGVGWRRQALGAIQCTGGHHHLGRAALRVLVVQGLHVFPPKHGEVRLGHFVFGRQVEPNLEQFGRIWRLHLAQRKHFAVHDALACGQPLHVARAKAGGGAQRIGVVDMALAHDGHRLKAAVRVGRKAGNGLAVVHAPAVLAGKVLAQIAPLQARVGLHGSVAARVGIHVVDAKQKRIDSRPGWRGQGRDAEDAAHGVLLHVIDEYEAGIGPQVAAPGVRYKNGMGLG